MDALKAEVRTHAAAKGIPWVSSNDVLMGLAWMLNSDASAADRPGQGPVGSQSTGMIGIDVHRNGLPAELGPPGFLGNLSVVCLMPWSEACLQAVCSCEVHLCHIGCACMQPDAFTES